MPAEKVAAFAVDIQKACVGTEIGFRMARPMKDVRVLWNFGDGQFSSESEPHHVFNAPGTYDITLSVTRISDGLIRTRTIENLVTIHPNPEADFTWGAQHSRGSTRRSHARSEPRRAAVLWVVDGDETQEGDVGGLAFPRGGEHRSSWWRVLPTAVNPSRTTSLEVGSRFGIGASSRFSPDETADMTLSAPQVRPMERPFVFRIEDGEGHIVFETTVPKAWDGSLPGNEQAQPGQKFAWTVVIQGEVGPSYFSDELVVE